jgi:hypothetical protein
MNKFKLVLAGLAAVGAAVVAAPEPAKAGGFGVSIGFGHGWGGYYPASYGGWGYGYRPVYGGWRYHRPFVRRVVVYRPWYPAYYHRPVVRRVVYGYPAYYRRPVVRRVVYGYPAYYHRPVVRRVVYRSYPGFYHRRAFYGRPHHVRFAGYGGHYGGWRHHGRW